MFSLKIIDTDGFLDMPISARELYFQFGMRADDDGFVGNPKRIMKMIGASDDDIKVLIVKKFIIPFESGVCVISDWKIHNYIQTDRYQETQFKLEKKALTEDDSGKYLLDGSIPKCIQNVSTGKVRLELGKVRDIYMSDFEEFWKEYPRKIGKGKASESWKKIKNRPSLEEILKSLEKQKKCQQWKKDGGQYIPHPATWLNQGRWDDEVEVEDEKPGIITFGNKKPIWQK